MNNVIQAESDADILACWPVLNLLRPHLQEAGFLTLIRSMMEEGYHLAFVAEDGVAVAAIGYRYQQKLHDGKQFYIDDLSTLEAARGKGHAGKLLDHVYDLARQRGYACVTLDSGPHRHDAHRLYLNKGFIIGSHHFLRKVQP